MRKLNLKLSVMFFAIFISTSAMAQYWNVGGTLNSVSSTPSFGTASSNNFDILFYRNGVFSGLLDDTAHNTSWGVYSLNSVTPGVGVSQNGTANTAIGIYSLQKNTTGFANTAVGSQALQLNTSSVYNTAVGWNALANDTSGSNTGIGASALEFNISGIGNTAVGSGALLSNTAGGSNIAVGVSALNYNQTGMHNTAVGSNASRQNVIGGSNSAVGTYSLYNSTTSFNSALGDSALYNNTTGADNTAVGYRTLLGSTTGNLNTVIGYLANVSGNYSNATAVGANAIVGASNSLVLGGTGTNAVNVGIGTQTPGNTLEIKSQTVGTSGLRLTNLTSVTATPPTSNVLSLDASNNVILVASSGVSTGPANGNFWGLTGNSGTTPGTGVGQNFMGTTDNEDVVFARNGVQSGLLNNGLSNTSWGVGALYPATTGAWNVADGYQALSSNTTGSANVADGYQALNANIAGSSNVGVGNQALYSTTNAIGFNTAVGDYALGNNITGYYNTAIGAQAEVNNGLTNSTSIGYNATATASSEIMLGNSSITELACEVDVTVLSDGRFKKNIKGNVPGLDFIRQLKPVTYNYDIHGLNKHMQPNAKPDSGEAQRIKEEGIAAKEKITYTGFIAQDVETAANKLGYDFSGVHKPQNDNDTYGLSYSEFVPSLVKADQELSIQNDSLQNANTQQQQEIQQVQQVNNNLQQQLNDLKTTISQMQTAMSQCCNNYSTSMATAAKPTLITGTDVPTLQQNTPNPYNASSVIGYYLPQSTTNAEIIVTDLSGNVIKSISLNGNGNGQITFSAGSLAAGSYFYTLLVNGQKIDTKQMIIAN